MAPLLGPPEEPFRHPPGTPFLTPSWHHFLTILCRPRASSELLRAAPAHVHSCLLLPVAACCCLLPPVAAQLPAGASLASGVVSRHFAESSVVSAAQPRERREADSSLVAGVVFENASHTLARASRCPTVLGHASDCFEAPVRLAPFPFHANKGFESELLSRTGV